MMKKKLNHILLVDDDEACNFFHTHLIERLNCAEHVTQVSDGAEALEFLTTPVEGAYPQPDILFLDINMPRMNGWEFLKAYEMLPDEQKAKIILILLTTSFNPEDKERAMAHPYVKDFANKYLSKESLLDILHRHFAQHFEPSEVE
jgi:CheY-like chemotaxis protein